MARSTNCGNRSNWAQLSLAVQYRLWTLGIRIETHENIVIANVVQAFAQT